jgi:hypothetical protein
MGLPAITGFIPHAGRFFHVDTDIGPEGELIVVTAYENGIDVSETVDLEELAETIERQRRDSHEPEFRCAPMFDERAADYVNP